MPTPATTTPASEPGDMHAAILNLCTSPRFTAAAPVAKLSMIRRTAGAAGVAPDDTRFTEALGAAVTAASATLPDGVPGTLQVV